MSQRVSLSLDSLGSDSRHRLADEVNKALERVEEFIQRHMDENLGEWPDKAIKVNIPLTVKASGEVLREVTWGVEVTLPQCGKRHTQFAFAEHGKLLTDVRGQLALPLERTTVDDWGGPTDEAER